MKLFFKDNKTGVCRVVDTANTPREIVQELENSFYRNLELEEASTYDEIELVSCLFQTLVNSGKLEQKFKNYLVSNLKSTKNELMLSECRLHIFLMNKITP